MRKSGTLWILFISILFPFSQGKNSDCVSTNKCSCYRSKEYEFQCPPGDYKIVLHTVPEQYILIDCDGLLEYDLDLFPDIEIGNVEHFFMRFCPLPAISFKPTLEKFNISKVTYMQLEDIPSNTVKIVTKDLFNGLSALEKLSISLFQIKLEQHFLKNLPNLVQLYLDNNDIHQVDASMFDHTSKLRVLHLSRNAMSYVPDGLFKNLTNLQQLHLWKNELTSLNKTTFTGLNQLKSLELSSNKIKFLDEDTFSELIELVNISLRSNNLNSVSSRIFRNNVALEGVRMGSNPNLNLSDYFFANLINLTNVNMDSSNLKNLPEHIFEGSFNLRDISLKNNDIRELSENVFKDLIKLEKLSLDGNGISTLPNGMFLSQKNLLELYLEGNNLTEINEMLFRNTVRLKILNLSNNKIATIDLNAFSNLNELTDVDLSYNRYDLKYDGKLVEGLNPFTACNGLQNINLSHNLIESFPEAIVDNKVNLQSLDLSNNKIQNLRVASLIKVSNNEVSVYVNNNNISALYFRDMKMYAIANAKNLDAVHNNDFSTVLYISENPIRCDCVNFDLIEYSNDELNPVIKTVVDIQMDDLQCQTPKALSHILLKDLKPYQITCPLEDKGCPKQCSCEYQPYDKCAVIDCARRNLTEPPVIHLMTNYLDNIEVNLESNALETAPYQGIGYDDVTRLYLANNHIKNISWIPPKVQKLTLNGNHLKSIDSTVLKILNNSVALQNLTLYGNPWRCGCSAVGLQNYLRNHYKKVNPNDVICEDNNKLLIERKELCKSNLTIIMVIALPILVILFTTALVAAFYFYYQEQIKVWLYAKNLCLWFVTEEELDKDKTYDIFISYSHKDEEFVIQNLLPVLEAGPNPFKICIHVRDWIPGEFIATQVTNSVLDSRRTLVVLSENFLESVWGKMEFRTAHTQAINEGRARVVVIKYGKLNEEKLDDELKAYLKTNTYVEWGDPWFWNKLKYALPHSRRNNYYNNNQKHANIMLKIDDKFELVSSSPTIHVESTPPVISLDPSLLKNHPLNFKSSDNIETPPAEAPLMIRR